MSGFSVKAGLINAEQQQQYEAKKNCIYGIKGATVQAIHGVAPKTFVPNAVHIECEDFFRQRGFVPDDQDKRLQRLRKKKPPPAQAHDPITRQTILAAKEIKRLKNSAQVETLEQRLDRLTKIEAEIQRKEKETNRIKAQFKAVDDARRAALDARAEKEEHSIAGDKALVLEKAFIERYDREEEVKVVNRIILNAHCHATLDEQVKEKIKRAQTLKDEERKLEKTIVERATKQLIEEDKKVALVKEKNLKYACDIKDQLRDRADLRYREMERIEDEAQMLRRANDAIKRDEERLARLEKERKDNYRAELDKIVNMSYTFKKMLCEQENAVDMRVRSFQKEKEERERELQRMKKLELEERERKRFMVSTVAQKAAEAKSHREEMAYMRERERLEREYRQKEKEAEIRKQKLIKEMKEAHVHQMDERRRLNALRVAQSENEFKMLIENMKKEEEKAEQKVAERRRAYECYGKDIMKEMCNKEERRRLQLDKEKNAVYELREKERQRAADIRAVINTKLNAMKNACLPMEYIRDVEKQLQSINRPGAKR